MSARCNATITPPPLALRCTKAAVSRYWRKAQSYVVSNDNHLTSSIHSRDVDTASDWNRAATRALGTYDNIFWATLSFRLNRVWNFSAEETQLSLTNRATRLEVSHGHQTWYHSICWVLFPSSVAGQSRRQNVPLPKCDIDRSNQDVPDNIDTAGPPFNVTQE